MNEENIDTLIKLIGSIRFSKNYPSFFPFLKEILNTAQPESISKLHPCSKFLLEVLKENLLNDELKLKYMGSLGNSFPQRMEYYRRKNRYTDLTIKIDKRLFRAHRIVLLDSCPIWNKLLTSKRNAVKVRKIDLTNRVDPKVFSRLLTFFYTGQLTMKLNQIWEFCSAYQFFNIQGVLNWAGKYLSKDVDFKNAIEMYRLSKQFNMVDLEKQTITVILENYKYVLDDKRISHCDAEELKKLFRLYNPEIKIDDSTHEHMFQALIRWTIVEPHTRGSHVPDLLKLIPESSLSDEFLKRIAAEHKNNRIFCEQFLAHRLSGQTNFQQESAFNRKQEVKEFEKNDPETSLKIKWPTYKLFSLGGNDDQGQTLNSVSCFDLDTGKWKLSTPMNRPVAHSGGVAVGDKIYLCGGLSSNDQVLDTLQSFDCTTETWSNLPPMPEPRWGCAAAELDGFIYVSGGRNKGNFATVFRYCIESRIWKTVRSMNNCRSVHQLVSIGSYLYAIGGYWENSFIEQYDPNRDEWKVLEKEEKRQQCSTSSTVLDGKIYICGDGFFDEYTPNFWDPWRSLLALNGLNGTTLVSHGGKLLALGGGNGPLEATANVMKFEGEWSLQEDMEMNVPRFNHCSFVVRC